MSEKLCVPCERAKAASAALGREHSRLRNCPKHRPDNWRQFCSACENWMDVTTPFFICRHCLDSLPSELRRRIVADESRDEQRKARREALVILKGADPNDIRMPPAPRAPREGCSHDAKWLRDQPNMITGAVDKFCIKCGAVRYAAPPKPREVIA